MRKRNYVFQDNKITPLGQMILKWGSKQSNNRKKGDRQYGKNNRDAKV